MAQSAALPGVGLGAMRLPLEVTNLRKSFIKDQYVLDGIQLTIQPGEVRGLAGANGSGKSTLVKILAGYHKPDEGEIRVGGRLLVAPLDPQDVRRAGVRFVHQDKGFVGGMSVLDNMCLGRGYTRGPLGKINWRAERRAIENEMQRHNIDVDLDADAIGLPVGLRAKLAIIRALHSRTGEERRVIVLDEATAAMGGDEASVLGEWVRQLAQREQLGVLFIGHEPRELCSISDRVSVLRGGRIVETFERADATSEGIVEALVGSPMTSFYPKRPGDRERGRSPVLEVTGLRGGSVKHVDLQLAPGEIVGLTGIQGSGFEDVPYLIFDPKRSAEGTLSMGGQQFDLRRTPISRRLKAGMALVPSDRVANGMAVQLGIRENSTQPRLRDYRKGGLLRLQKERVDTARLISEMRVVSRGPETEMSLMSGGNQQKVVLGKWLNSGPRVLLLHEPTEGIDVVTKREIFRILGEQARRGMAILVASVEYEDLANVCDRILVMGDGKVYAEVDARTTTGDDLMAMAYGASVGLGEAGPDGRTRWQE
jgi:ribose transport system ATP-binding protein